MVSPSPMDVGNVVAALVEHAAPSALSRDALHRSLELLHADAQQAHPDFEPLVDAWVAALLNALQEVEPETWPDRVGALRGPDLWHACATAHGDPTALAAFERALMPEVDRALSRFTLAADVAQEMRQSLRIHLLVAEPGRPARVGQYRGQGALSTWVRTTAARMTINRLQRTKKWSPLEEAAEPAMLSTPEFAQLREQHRALFVAAFQEGFAQLEPRERNLLRMHHLDGATTTSLGRAYRVHTATAARWLVRARERLVEQFEVAAAARLGDHSELPALLGLVRSRLETSLRTLLASRQGHLGQ